jgi:hypothetical protein
MSTSWKESGCESLFVNYWWNLVYSGGLHVYYAWSGVGSVIGPALTRLDGQRGRGAWLAVLSLCGEGGRACTVVWSGLCGGVAVAVVRNPHQDHAQGDGDNVRGAEGAISRRNYSLLFVFFLLDSSSCSINLVFSITSWVTSKTVMVLVDRSFRSRCMCSSSLTLQCYLFHIDNLIIQKNYVIRQFTVLPLRANWARLWVLILRVSRLR